VNEFKFSVDPEDVLHVTTTTIQSDFKFSVDPED